mmetsp:Transcript_33053/g.98238  ORF Transcript_33053/g.98238 Transcript_33053/m.98238 type:complete len:245 (+) Transcript_33053:212-946(+)
MNLVSASVAVKPVKKLTRMSTPKKAVVKMTQTVSNESSGCWSLYAIWNGRTIASMTTKRMTIMSHASLPNQFGFSTYSTRHVHRPFSVSMSSSLSARALSVLARFKGTEESPDVLEFLSRSTVCCCSGVMMLDSLLPDLLLPSLLVKLSPRSSVEPFFRRSRSRDKSFGNWCFTWASFDLLEVLEDSDPEQSCRARNRLTALLAEVCLRKSSCASYLVSCVSCVSLASRLVLMLNSTCWGSTSA